MGELLKNHAFAAHAIAAAGSHMLSTALTYLLDTVKTLIQVGSDSSKQLTTVQVFDRVRALSGYSGLYSGFGCLAFGRILGVGTRFGTYEILAAFCKGLFFILYAVIYVAIAYIRALLASGNHANWILQTTLSVPMSMVVCACFCAYGREDDHVYVSEALMAGVAAGFLESLSSSPFELMKTRAQALNHSAGLLSTLTKYPNMIDALKEYPWMMTGSGRAPSVSNVRRTSDIISLEGWGALWRGLRSGVVRDSIFGGIFFSSWQFLHRAMLEWNAVNMDPPPSFLLFFGFAEEIGPLSPLYVSLAAGFSGSIAAAASHCFDTARTRSQCIVLPKYISMERRLLKWTLPGKRFERFTGIHPTDRNILFHGIGLRMARSGIASFMLVGGYFWAVDHLVSR
ncbi:hypothetical protein RJ639_036034 [Escallonia herrerae]|uniref:Uncharacterized protein n=1 Tax=Escallonia herrerae TaxID=1293975 RepID=A0AA88X396_9ASTE|nr:hypothetical protein RJ639_036034 [Escallonia herrerae]